MIAGVIILTGVAVFGVRLPSNWLTLSLCVAIGALAFCSLGVAATSLTTDSSSEAAPAVLNGLFFPILFISGAFFPVSGASFLSKIAEVFPVRPFIMATFSTFDPRQHGAHLDGSELLFIAVWGILGAVVGSAIFPMGTGPEVINVVSRYRSSRSW